MPELLLTFIYALFAVLGFCIIFHVPGRHMPAAVVIGAISWLIFEIFAAKGASPVIACFAAACAVGLLSDIASRVLKDAATIFVIPGILCLVPGSGMYRTMLETVNGQLSQAALTGCETLMQAGAIALGLLVIGGVLRIILAIGRRAEDLAQKF